MTDKREREREREKETEREREREREIDQIIHNQPTTSNTRNLVFPFDKGINHHPTLQYSTLDIIIIILLLCCSLLLR